MAKSKLPTDDSAVATAEAPTAAPQSPSLQPTAPQQNSHQQLAVSRQQLIAGLMKTEAIQKSEFAACHPSEELMEAISTNIASGTDLFRLSDLPKAKIPSGGTESFIIIDVEGERMTKTIEGVMVYFASAGALWPYNEQSEGMKPLLVSRDLRTAVKLGDDYGDLDPTEIEKCVIDMDPQGREIYDWTKLIYNQWGSGKNGRGKRCKETRLLCVLTKDSISPLFLRVPPTSIGAFTQFMKRITLEKQLPFYRVCVRLNLEKDTNEEGTAYCKIKPQFVSSISKEEGQYFKAQYTDSLGQAMEDAANEAGTDPEDRDE